MNAASRFVCLSLLGLIVGQCLVSCASDQPKRRERMAPKVSDSTLPWNRPAKWEGNARYGS
ncbi:MAG: hypothetical protein U0984_04985, partial [Prosthecobacter sp.]|nr:hypothetical protein [Prosthecobacter sp.]